MNPFIDYDLIDLDDLPDENGWNTDDFFDAIFSPRSVNGEEFTHWQGVLKKAKKPGYWFLPNPYPVETKDYSNIEWAKTSPAKPTRFINCWVELDPIIQPQSVVEAEFVIKSHVTLLNNLVHAGLTEPTAVVMSNDFRVILGQRPWGKSIHLFWHLEEPVTEETWRTLQVGLAALFNADPFSTNPHAVARLGGMESKNYCQTILHLGEATTKFHLMNSLLMLKTDDPLQVVRARFGRYGSMVKK